MNIPRLIGAMIVGFILVSGTDYLIHEVWLKPEYQATKELWRTEADMMARMPWMFGAEFLFAATFVLDLGTEDLPRQPNCTRRLYSAF